MRTLQNEVSCLPDVISFSLLSHPTSMIWLSDLLQYILTLLDGTGNAASLIIMIL
jgi:hypothetical protein